MGDFILPPEVDISPYSSYFLLSVTFPEYRTEILMADEKRYPQDGFAPVAGIRQPWPSGYRHTPAPVSVQRTPSRSPSSAPPALRPQPQKLTAPSVYRPHTAAPVLLHRTLSRSPSSAPPAFHPQSPLLTAPTVYCSTASLVGPVQRAPIERPPASSNLLSPLPPVNASTIVGTRTIQRREQILPFASSTVHEQGYERYNRLRELLNDARIVLSELKEVRDYETISSKVGKWYESLWGQLKKAEQWEKENRPKNIHVEIIVPDEIYFPLAEMCVGYRRELNDSYKGFQESILKEKAAVLEKYQQNNNNNNNNVEGADEDDDPNPLSVPKTLFRWVSTEEAKRAKKEGIQYHLEGGGIPTSTKGSVAVAITSGAVCTNKCLVITTSKIPNFKFEYVPTKSKLKEVKVKCNIPAEAID